MTRVICLFLLIPSLVQAQVLGLNIGIDQDSCKDKNCTWIIPNVIETAHKGDLEGRPPDPRYHASCCFGEKARLKFVTYDLPPVQKLLGAEIWNQLTLEKINVGWLAYKVRGTPLDAQRFQIIGQETVMVRTFGKFDRVGVKGVYLLLYVHDTNSAIGLGLRVPGYSLLTESQFSDITWQFDFK